jgi:hypothetical protein
MQRAITEPKSANQPIKNKPPSLNLKKNKAKTQKNTRKSNYATTKLFPKKTKRISRENLN